MKDFIKRKAKDSLRFKILIGIVTVLLIVLMFPKGESIESEVSEGSIWIHDDLIASFSFPVFKNAAIYRVELKEAEQGVYPVFLREGISTADILDSLKRYNDFLIKSIDSSLSVNSEEVFNPTFLSFASFNTFKQVRSQERNLVLSRLVNMRTAFNAVQNLLNNVYKNGILSVNPASLQKDSIALRTGNIDRIEPGSNYLLPDQASEVVKNNLNEFNLPEDIKDAVLEYTLHFVFPNIIYSSQLTQEEIVQAQNVVSQYSGIVNENERIVAKHDRITKDVKLKIDSYREAKGERIGGEGILLQMVGKFLHISFLITLFVIYIYLFRKKIYHNNQKILLIAIVFIFLSFITYLVNQISIRAPLQLLIFIPSASMLLTIIFDSRVGFYSTIILALIVGALRGNVYTFTATHIFAGALSVYTVRDIKNRSQIFRSFLFILTGYIIAVLAFGLERFAPVDIILIEMAFVGSNSLISPVLTYGLLIFFERFFKITTDLTLLELSNFDRPLLKDLARKAPGTFNHSMTMGTLAETAAERVGANPLLARVGAYYHDIGKTITPQNYVENQLNNQNIHENLTPEESANLISRHVTEGIQLAQENNLPQEIIDFIPTHHGTMEMSYFYDKAVKLYGEEKVDRNEYRYPGPKPNTKETAILMIADGCESAVRSIEDADPVKVENLIDNIIQSRIDDGQLDESPLTFADIDKIKEAFLSILLGQHHRRIRYPKQDEIEKGIEDPKK
jgi:putative nucleotidyltransferase with HDIG domain